MNEKLKAFLEAYSESADKLTDTIKADGVDLKEVASEALKMYRSLNETDTKTDEVLDKMDAALAVARAAQARITAVADAAKADAAREDRKKKLEADAADLEALGKAVDEAVADTEPAVEEVKDAEPAAPETPVEPAAEGQPIDKELAVTASKQVDFSKMPSSTPPPPVEEEKPYSIVAAADIPDLPSGSELKGLEGLGNAYSKKIGSMARLGPNRTMTAPLATIHRKRRPELAYVPVSGNNEWGDVTAALKYASDLGRYGGKIENLIAAGGWCAPSQTIYDLCPPARVTRGVDIPEVPAPRGGIRYPNGLDLTAIYNGGFHQTEAEAIAGTEKPCISIPCPTFVDVRLDVDGLCIESPILTEAAFPELTRTFMANALALHMRRINAFKIARMVALSTANTITPVPDFGISNNSLEYIEHHAMWSRYQNFLDEDAPMEAVAPAWLRGPIRADLATKNGVALQDMTNARMDALFAARGIRMQWIMDWQSALVTGTATDFGGATIQDTWPANVTILIYPAGTFFAATTDVITLDTVYDSTNLSTNVFTKLFTEEGIQVARQCYTSYALTMPVCTTGGSGAQYAKACAGAEALPAPA